MERNVENEIVLRNRVIPRKSAGMNAENGEASGETPREWDDITSEDDFRTLQAIQVPVDKPSSRCSSTTRSLFSRATSSTASNYDVIGNLHLQIQELQEKLRLVELREQLRVMEERSQSTRGTSSTGQTSEYGGSGEENNDSSCSRSKSQRRIQEWINNVEKARDRQSSGSRHSQRQYQGRISEDRGSLRSLQVPVKKEAAGGGVACAKASVKYARENAQVSVLNEKGNVEISETKEFLSKLLNRQSAGKTLPNFDGSPLNWPFFYEEFLATSKSCGFSEQENLSRLKHALQGPALDSVKHLLCIPGSLQRVIEVLKHRFGRPDKIIKEAMTILSNMPPMKSDTFSGLSTLATELGNVVAMVKLLKRDNFLFNPFLLDQMVSKLTPTLKLQWGEHALTLATDAIDLGQFSNWLDKKGEALSFVESTFIGASYSCTRKSLPPSPIATDPKEHDFPDKPSYSKDKSSQPMIKCTFCNSTSHGLGECFKFGKVDYDSRRTWGMEQRLCFRCLKKGHRSILCRSKFSCAICKGRHNKLFHPSDNLDVPSGKAATHVNNEVVSLPKSIFKVIPIRLQGPRGELQCFAFLDDGSSVTMIDEGVAEELGFVGVVQPLSLTWTDERTREEPKSRNVKISVGGMEENAKMFQVYARTVSKLSLPSQTVDVQALEDHYAHIKGLNGKSLSYFEAKPILLIGQDNWPLIISHQVVYGPWKGPVASRTKLGWVIHGNVATSKGKVVNHAEYQCTHVLTEGNDEYLYQLVENSFSTEGFGVRCDSKNGRTTEDARAEEIFAETTILQDNNHWETGLLWRKGATLPQNRSMALQRLHSLERRMDKDEKFASAYIAKMEENFAKGYARVLKREEWDSMKPGKRWFLPHLPVVNPNKPGKLRIVFDASAKFQGVSLNSFLLKGPDLLVHLCGLLWRFRERKVAVCGDIKEMFSQIYIRNEDQQAQLFLWRGLDRLKPPKVCVMQVMLFGAVCSPYSAQQVKNHNAARFERIHPRAAQAIQRNHYMDDYLDSFDSDDEAKRIIGQVIDIHKKGGFMICNFSSNSLPVLESIPEDRKTEASKIFQIHKESASEKLLGMWWNAKDDSFQFKTPLERYSSIIDKPPTKREVLRIIMSLFDPLGILAQLTVEAKLLLQDIWRSKVDWDETILPSHLQKWERWLNRAKTIDHFQVPRCYGTGVGGTLQAQLHIFCDASEKAFATVAYLRLLKRSGIETSFIAARTRVAPLKPMSIPRLELQAAVMASRLANAIQEEHAVHFERLYMWSDSRTVLSWLQREAYKFKQFVAHRVGEIQENTSIKCWNWVPTEQNAADMATKVQKKDEIILSERWLYGPQFLLDSEEKWPSWSRDEADEQLFSHELRSSERQFIGMITTTHRFPLPDIDRAKSWLSLIRITAWLVRLEDICQNPKNRKEIRKGDLKVDELDKAELCWLQRIQSECYPDELRCLERSGKIGRSSKIFALCPKLDTQHVLRIRGRVGRAKDVDHDVNEPIIIGGVELRYTRLLIMHYHVKFAHQGQETVANAIRQKYWIPKLRSAVKGVFKSCAFCKIVKSKPITPSMGDLPKERLDHHSAPFTHTGVDYFGPIMIKHGRKQEKRYGVLFTCLTTRAVHLEIAHSLSTDSAIMAIRRMVARRGEPHTFFSDNGTNFRGAQRELFEAMEELDNQRLEQFCSGRRIRWKFIPPGAPHMGGAWERLIQAVKKALNVILYDHTPTDEVLLTVVAEAENIVNSRPLTHVSLDSADEECLTPNHFLMGRNGAGFPCVEPNICLRRSWREAQQIADHFWNRWVREYLPTLTRRTKWFRDVPPITVGDVVIVVDPSGPRNFWPRGIIETVYPDERGQVRSADVRTIDGLFRRPACRLCPLDIKQDSSTRTGSQN